MATTETPSEASAILSAPPGPSRSWRGAVTSTEIDTRLFGDGARWSRSGSVSTSCPAVTSSPRGTSGTCPFRAPRSPSWPPAWCSSSCRGTSTSRSDRCSASSATRWRSSRPTACSPSSTSSRPGRPRGQLASWVVALVFGIALGAVVGGMQGFIVAYVGVPAFIVTLGGFLVWRGLIFRTGDKQGQTLAPLDETFQLIGGGAEGLPGRVEELGGRRCSAAPASSLSHRCSPAAAGSATSSASGRMWVDDRASAVVGCAWRAGRQSGSSRTSYDLADHGGSDGRRLSGRDPDRRHAC